MAVNVNNVERKVFKYYEGLCSSSDFTKEIAKVLALGVKTKSVKDIDGNVLEEPLIVMSKNWDIVYPAPDTSLNIDLNNLTVEEYKAKILNQVNKISDTVILKTTTTPKDLTDGEVDELTVDTDSNKASLTMYLEIYKPAYIANPEEYPLDCERKGITPKLITKELYEKSLQATHAVEEEIYANNDGWQSEKKCTVDKKDESTIGSLELKEAECDAYVKKINEIYGDMSFRLPDNTGSTFIEINSAYLAKIKQNDAELYDLILNTLNGGEGIEPKTYTLLHSLVIEIIKDTQDVYTMMFEGIRKTITYTIPKGAEYAVKYIPTETLTPEFYLDGIYIPVNTNVYHTDNQRIIFDDTLTFEASQEGVLVIRYAYESSENEIISERATLLNNHYVLMRMFDNINEEKNGPMDNVYNASGELVQTNSHISPWSKLSWYQDFEEVMIDSIDSDVSISSIHDGTVFVPLETAGLNADTKIRYWINTNNNRFSLVVMGNPSLDYERDRHLISGCYCGRIDSFDNSINDTAGNFALFTSSSTEPCNTVLTTEKVIYNMQNYALSEAEIISGNYDTVEFENFIKACPWSTPCTNGQEYYIQLSDNTYFNEEKWPKYIIVDANTKIPVTGFVTGKKQFIGNNGKSDVLHLTIDATHAEKYGSEAYEIYVSFSYYQEKFVITSGVARDVFGNVIDVDKVKDYGVNTSDGITSIMMYHTRSKAYYQKHHMLFATTEEYMSKAMYGKSSYTGEYYADRIKITHGNDGPRGTLSDLLVIDSASLYALDELVINKDFEKNPDEYEETFVFFPITAPYSPLSDSPNARYGLAIKKQEVEPAYTDEEIILKLAAQSLSDFTEHWKNVQSDIYPRDTVDECSVYWSIVPGTAWYGNVNTPSEYSPVQLAVINTSEYQGDLDSPIIPVDGVTLEQGKLQADETLSYLKISGFTAEPGDIIAYGTSTTPISSFGLGAQAKAVLYDGTTENESFEYNINGVPYTANIGEELPLNDVQLTDAHPNKYLLLYSIKESVVDSDDVAVNPSLTLGTKRYTINKFACVPLKDEGHDDNWLLQYPCTINAYIEGGKGKLIFKEAETSAISTTIQYDSSFDLYMAPAEGYTVKTVTLINTSTSEEIEVIDTFDSVQIDTVTCKHAKLENVTKNIQVKVLFEVNA